MHSKLKVFIPVGNPEQYISRIIDHMCEQHNFEIVYQIFNADFLIIPIAGFNSNSTLLIENQNYKKPIIVIDYTEYGVHVLRKTNYFDETCSASFVGFNSDSIDKRFLQNNYTVQINNFLKTNLDNIRVYFMRELSKLTFNQQRLLFPFNVQPIDYVLFPPQYGDFEPDSKENFLKRNTAVAHIWGKSNSDRMALHGALMLEASKTKNYFNTLVSTEQYSEYLQREKDNISGILLLHKNGYVKGERINFLPILFNTRTFIDLYGNGMKCFRNAEAAYNCVSIKQDCSQLKFAYDWVDSENCIMLPNKCDNHSIDIDKSIKIINDVIDMSGQFNPDNLYEIYLKSCETAKKYVLKTYISNYIAPCLYAIL